MEWKPRSSTAGPRAAMYSGVANGLARGANSPTFIPPTYVLAVELRLPSPALVVLVGPSGAGKSVWAAEQFRPDQIVSTDRLRALVGEGEHDQRAGTDAFDVLDLVLERRLKRKRLTVVDSLGLDPAERQ